MTAPLIAILDDEPQIRALLSETLTEAGFRTASFARATEFEAALARDADAAARHLEAHIKNGLIHPLEALKAD